MIKCETSKGNCNLEVAGSLVEIITDLSIIIMGTREGLPHETKGNFDRALRNFLTDEKSPYYTEVLT